MDIARSALTKLANGNLSAPSHTWRLGPIATLAERLAIVECRVARIKIANVPR